MNELIVWREVAIVVVASGVFFAIGGGWTFRLCLMWALAYLTGFFIGVL